MKTAQNFGLMYILLAIIQILICNYCQFSPLLVLSVLPVMILCLPLSVGTIPAMLIAFATGLAVDWLSEGLLGLNALSLVPVAAVRKPIMQLFFGKDLIDRKDSLSFRKNGFGKISAAILTFHAIFLAIYITADGAGMRPFWFNLARFGISEASGYLISVIVASSLIPDDKK